jgi:hypothetical protein
MRVLIFIFLLSFLPNQVKGQDSPLFIIVSCSEGVMLDGKLVSPGQIVDANSKQLTIPRKGYAGVVTIDGYAMEFNGTVSVSRMNGEVRWHYRPRIGAVYACGPFGPYVITAPENQLGDILGDSMVVAIKDKAGAEQSYVIEVLNMFDQILRRDTSAGNWKIIEVGSLMQNEEAILFGAKSKRENLYEQHLAKRSSFARKDKALYDISRIPQTSTNKEYLLAVYQLNNLYHDLVFLLYQMERSNYQSQNKIFSNYIDQQKKKYQFELFDFHK